MVEKIKRSERAVWAKEKWKKMRIEEQREEREKEGGRGCYMRLRSRLLRLQVTLR